MAGEGKILQEARETKGWSYQDVENATKIQVRYLEALEQENYELMPGRVYIKGFLRNYARELGLDPQQIMDAYNSSLSQEATQESHRPLTPIQSTPVWFKPIALLSMAILAVVIVFGIVYFTQNNGNPGTSEYSPTPLLSAPPTTINPPPEQNVPEPAPEPETQSPVIYEGVVAELTFTEDCWLKVRVDGTLVQDGMSAAGTSKQLQATKKIEFVTIGNAGGLRLKVNGKEMPVLGASGEVVWNYVITEDSLNNT